MLSFFLPFALSLTATAATPDTTADATTTLEPQPERALGVDIEVDPLAYALGGASVHAGLHIKRVRLDLGVFSLPVPEAIHGNEGFHAQGHGFGLKADWFVKEGNKGLHLGVQTDLTHQTVTEEESTETARYRELAVGGRVGYRIQHKSGLYVDPWVGLAYRTNTPTELELGDRTFTQSKLMPFPTLHVGWRL
jgi:hypothetical protein